MKKTVVLLLVLIVTLSATAFAEDSALLPNGVLYRNGISEADYQRAVQANKDYKVVSDYIFFDTLPSMQLALKAGRIKQMIVPEPVAVYVCAHDTDCQYELGKGRRLLSMAVREADQELFDTLDAAIATLLQEGRVQQLFDECMDNIESDPIPTALPAAKEGTTVRVVVTGDMPPMDYMTADGTPAGFNVALLAEITERSGIGFELVTADSASRLAMLASGRADVVFWMQKDIRTNSDGSIQTVEEIGEGVLLTKAYLEMQSAKVMLKPSEDR